MDGYKLSRQFFNWCFENPEKVSPNHSAIYFFAIEHCNRLGWKEKFGFPTQMVMDAIGIRKHQTYIKYFNDLVEWGFFKLVQKSANQYSANIISIQSAVPKNGKALDKAFINHAAKQRTKQTQSNGQSNGQSNSSIDKQETINQETTNHKPRNNDADESASPEKSVHSSCKKVFEEKCFSLGKELYWTGMHGKSLKMLLEKLKFSYRTRNKDALPSDEQLVESFTMLIDKLPAWYKDNHFDLSVINSKYDAIVSEIRKSVTANPENRTQRGFSKIDEMFTNTGTGSKV
jgi:hypothetical protein